MLSLKLSFMSSKDRKNLNILTVALLKLCQMKQCIVLTVQYFYLQRNKSPFPVLLSTRDEGVAIAFYEN